jgi:uncharacterized membrane protein YwaF
MFLAEAPPVSNPLLKYQWPWYIITFEIAACLGFLGLYLLSNYLKTVIKPIYHLFLNIQKSKS